MSRHWYDLARLAGRDPVSVPIEYVGLRPGEKLHETLEENDDVQVVFSNEEIDEKIA